MGYINPSRIATEQDIWILLKTDCISCVSCCLYNTVFAVWIEGQMKKNAYWLWKKPPILKEPEQCQLFTTSSDRLYLPCAEPKSARHAKKGYTFNLSLEEDRLMMRKLHDRCDTNKFLVHYQPESQSKCTLPRAPQVFVALVRIGSTLMKKSFTTSFWGHTFILENLELHFSFDRL